ncbi:MAG: energy transducer TonB [Burkholderiales bacterium]
MLHAAFDRLRSRLAANPDAWPLAVALLASAALHTSFFAIYFGMRGPAAPTTTPATRLEATLADPEQNAPAVLASAAPAPFAVPATSEPAPTPPQPETPPPRAPAADRTSKARTADFGDLRIVASLVADTTKLGDLVDRQMREFPAEIDWPPRVDGRISVRYPPAALAAGREDTVAVWFIVDAQGDPQEITVTQGSEEFAAVVTAALRDAKFVPARSSFQPIAFPLALEFRFALDAGSPPATETAKAGR